MKGRVRLLHAVSRGVAALVLALLTAIPADAQHRRNEFGPTGATCRDACGPDCPPTCSTWRYTECISPKRFRHVTRHTCGTHQGCRDHDRCLDNCAAQGVSQEGLDFVIATCNRQCHMLAHEWAMSQYGTATGTQYVNSWRKGGGPYSGERTWEYTRDRPRGPERIGECPQCTQCGQDGRCRMIEGMTCAPCRSCGDVHLRTLDGLSYDLQSSGDFILVDSPDGARIEARQVPMAGGASVNAAVAVRLGGHRVVASVQPERSLLVDGHTVDLQVGESLDLGDGVGVLLTDRAIVVTTQSGWRVTARLYRAHLDIAVEFPDELRGRLAGLLGDADGDHRNDLRARDGTLHAIELTEDDLYDGFADSWRLAAGNSLLKGLSWPDGVPQGGSGRPATIATLVDLDEATLAIAADVCFEAGLGPGPQFDMCVFDVAFTGDPDMALGAAVSAEGVADVVLLAEATGGSSQDSGGDLSAASEAVAGGQLTAHVGGAVGVDDYVTIVPAGSPPTTRDNHAKLDESGAVQVRVPPEPGPYEVRHVRRSDGAVVASRPLLVQPLAARLIAEPHARAGSRLPVRVEGAGNPDDLIAIVPANAPAGSIGNHRRRGVADQLEILVPSAPGRYELRYLLDQRRHQVYSQPLDVASPVLTLGAPERTKAGSSVQVRIDGWANEGDLVCVVPKGAPNESIGAHVRTTEAATQEVVVKRLAPEPGDYEIRYVIDQGRRVIASRSLTLE